VTALLVLALVGVVFLAVVIVAAAEDDPDGLQDGDATSPDVFEATPNSEEAA
jgi:hypothetical protein